MIKISKYRSEWKYLLRNQELSSMKERVSKILELDPHTPSCGRYLIHSLYFDNYRNDSLYGKLAGLGIRYKWRIRYYGDDLTYIKLEKKEKLDAGGRKKACKLTIDEYNLIVSGNIEELVYETSKKLIKELAVDMMKNGYHPEIIIDYERIAYVEEISNVRVTFDMKISASYELDKFLDNDYRKFYIMPSNVNLLEVKFDHILPSYIKNILELNSMNQTSFSKYYFGRKIVDSYMR